MAPVVLELRAQPHHFDVSICSTGQHTTMLDGAMGAFDLKAKQQDVGNSQKSGLPTPID